MGYVLRGAEQALVYPKGRQEELEFLGCFIYVLLLALNRETTQFLGKGTTSMKAIFSTAVSKQAGMSVQSAFCCCCC
jgi:hypothetical protein